MSKLIRTQFVGYLISGVLATTTDYIIYNLLVHNAIDFSIAKIISFLCGTIVAYFYNKNLTFKSPQYSYIQAFKFFTLYAISMIFNVTINKFGLLILSKIIKLPLALTIAFLFATLCSMIINFFGQKYLIFR